MLLSIPSVSLIHILSLGSPKITCSQGSLMISVDQRSRHMYKRQYKRSICTKTHSQTIRVQTPILSHRDKSLNVFDSVSPCVKWGIIYLSMLWKGLWYMNIYLCITCFSFLFHRAQARYIVSETTGETHKALQILLHHLRDLSLQDLKV